MTDAPEPPPARVVRDRLAIERVPDLADSLTMLRYGQRVVVGRDGRVLTRAARTWRGLAMGALIGAVASVFTMGNPVRAALMLGGWIVAVAVSRSGQRRLRAVLRRMDAHDLDGAERLLDEIHPLLHGQRAHLAQIRAVIAERRGQLDVALEHAAACERLLPNPAGTFAITYWQNQFNRARWLLELGRADDARAALARCDRAPGGEWYALQHRALVLRAAMAGIAKLPDEGDLDAWLRDALRYNHTGELLALIGWALDAHGDAAGAEHAFAEAAPRFLAGTELFARVAPLTWAELGPRLEAAQRAAAAAAADA